MLFHLGSILSHLCLRACSVHCTCAASRNRRNLYSAFFFRLLWDFPTCCFWLISLCNMYVYTSNSLIETFLSKEQVLWPMQSSEQEKAALVWQSKIIELYKLQDTLPSLALIWLCMRELSGIITVEGKAKMLKPAFPTIANPTCRFIPFLFLS